HQHSSSRSSLPQVVCFACGCWGDLRVGAAWIRTCAHRNGGTNPIFRHGCPVPPLTEEDLLADALNFESGLFCATRRRDATLQIGDDNANSLEIAGHDAG